MPDISNPNENLFLGLDPTVFARKYFNFQTESDARVLVCVKPQDPQGMGGWSPDVLNDTTQFPSDCNLYISISSCKRLDDISDVNYNQYRNLTKCVSQIHMFMLDDLGDETTPNKPDYNNLAIPPTWLIETSPNNYQALYVLTEPLKDKNLGNQIAKQLPAQARSDKAAVNIVRWARLPGGINNKAKYITKEYPKGYPVTVKVGNPETTYHVKEIMDAFNIQIEQTTSKPNQLEAKPAIQPLQGLARHIDALLAIPPDVDYQTWFNIACVLHPWGEQGLAPWIEWSQSSTTHKLSEAELERKFNDVEYDILDPKGHDNVLSWPWLQNKAMDYGWDYDDYSRRQVPLLTKRILETKDEDELQTLALPIHDAYLTGPHLSHICHTIQLHAQDILKVKMTIPEIRAMINSLNGIGPEDDSWTYALTDEGNLRRFHDAFDGYYYYVKELGKHLEWDANHKEQWVEDQTTQGIALKTINLIPKLEKKPLNETQVNLLLKWRNKCGGMGHISALTNLIRKDQSISKSFHEFNTNPVQMGVKPNSVLNLETNYVSANIAENLITMETAITHDENATCPRWEQFIHEIMDGDKDMARFLQILSGYALFGGNPEQVFIILNGDGANGKSTFVNTLEHILKDYAATTSPATLIKPAFSKSGGAAAPDLMRLFRKRLVLCNEWDENAYLNESLMKSLTGASDPISVRALYANNYLTFKPDFLIMIATNHIPKIISMDYGIWRRLIIIPFPVNFDDPEHINKKDRYLYDHFINKEAAGIFNWMIEGYRLWREQGVIDSAPEIVLNTKKEYKKEMDIIAQFIEECCVIDEPKTKITSAELYTAYTQWCKDNGNHFKANRTFSRNMIERGHKRTRIGTVNGFKDIRLLTLSEKAEQYQQVLNDERDDAEVTTRLN